MHLESFRVFALLGFLFIPALAHNPIPTVPLPSKTLQSRGYVASLTPMERCGQSGCIMSGKDSAGKPIFEDYGCKHCADDWIAPEVPLEVRNLTKRGAAGSMDQMKLCGDRGCIMTGKSPDGRPLFGGMDCDHCADDWIPPKTTTLALTVGDCSSMKTTQNSIVTSTVIAIQRTTVTVTTLTVLTAVATAVETRIVTSTSVEVAYAVRTSWTTQTAPATITNLITSGQGPVEDCLRIGTLDQGGALWSGQACKGDPTFVGDQGCSRAGTMDAGGALWVGEGCAKFRKWNR